METKFKNIIENLLLEKENSYYSVDDAKEIYRKLKKLLPMRLPNVRFSARDERGNKTIKIDKYFEISFTFNLGIFVIQNWDPIPNFKKIVNMLKKYFGDVYTEENNYINCRDFGDSYEEYIKIHIPKRLNKLPPKKEILRKLKKIKTTKEANNFSYYLDTLTDPRKVDIEQRNLRAKADVLYIHPDHDMFKVVEYKGNYFHSDGFNWFYGQDFKEAKLILFYRKLAVDITNFLLQKNMDISAFGPADAFD